MAKTDFDELAVESYNGKHYDRSKSNKYKKNIPETNSIYTKECIKCKKVLPATADNFYRDRYRYDGFMPKCKECKKREYHEKKAKQKSKIISFRVQKDVYNNNKKEIRKKINELLKSEFENNVDEKIVELEKELNKLKSDNLDNEDGIYEWVKTLTKDKRNLLDQTKISEKIKEELFK